MTKSEVVQHWEKGAIDSLEVARMCLEAEKYEHALFNAHLSVEKILKAKYIEEHDAPCPHTHDLCEIAKHLSVGFNDDHMATLREMGRLAVQARYADHEWSQDQANPSNAQHWIDRASEFISLLSDA